MKNATFRQWRVFAEVARHLSFSKAAEVLHLTPPAVTQQVKELEGHVGMPLFSRQGRQVTLTTAGEYMLVYARRLMATVQEAEEAVARLMGSEAGVLNLGVVSTAKYFVPQLLARFRHDYPGVDLRLQVGNRGQVLQWVRSGEVDLAVMGKPPPELPVRAEPFATHPLVFIGPADHPLAKAGPAGPHSVHLLRGDAFILREPGSGTRAALERFCDAHHLVLQSTMDMPGNEAIKQAVMAGLGLSFLSLHTVGLELDNGLLAVLPIEDTPVMRRWYAVHPASKPLSPPAARFRGFVLEHAAAHLAGQFGRWLQAGDARQPNVPVDTP